MPIRVPTVTGPQVAEQGLQTAPQRSAASPGLLDNPQLAQMGRAMVEVGAQIQERTDADLLMRAETEIKNRYAQWEADARQRRGQQAWGVAQDAGKFWDEQGGKVGEMLTSPRQQALFGQTVQKLRTQSLGIFAAHEADQRRVSLDESAQGSIVGSINLAAANPTPEVIASTKADVIKRNQMRAQINGWAPERAQAEEANYLTNLHKQVLQALVRSDPAQAEAYFKANEQEIAGSQRAELGDFARRATATRLGDTAAEAAWAALGPKGDRDAVQLDVLEARIRKELAGNEEATKSAIAGVRERAQAFKDGRRERGEQLEASVNQAILDGATGAQIRSMPAFLQLPPEQARRIADFMENRDLRRVQRAAAEASRADAEESRNQRRLARQGFGAYLTYSDPQTLAGMTEAQVLNLLPTLGNELTGNLIEKKRQLSQGAGKLAEARMDTDDFNRVAQDMGLRPFANNQSEDQKAALGEARFRVEQRIAAEQQRLGKVLTRDERLALVRSEVAQTVKVSGWFGSSDVPVIALTPDQVSKVVIPAGDRQQLVADMRTMYERTGDPRFAPTDDNLRRWFLRSRSQAANLIPPAKP